MPSADMRLARSFSLPVSLPPGLVPPFLEDNEMPAPPVAAQYVQPHVALAGSLMQQMAVYAQHKSVATGRTVFYGTMNGQDSALLVAAYASAFRDKGK